MMINSKAGDTVSASVTRNTDPDARVRAGGVFKIQCIDKDGNLKWEAESHNLVVNQGLQSMNAVYFSAATQITTWYIGLYGAASSNNPAAGDTMASHAGWTEQTGYTISGNNTIRATCTFGTATTADPSVITNSASPAAFSITGTATIGGAFLTSSNTKGGTTGTLFSAADFSAPGDRSVANGDTLNVTYTFSLDAV
jgi:hypothetical protein